MRYRRWIFPASLCILALYTALYAARDETWTTPRRLALSVQLPPNLTHWGWGLLFAAAIVALTMAFGRWYCLLICPMGTLQETFSRLGVQQGRKRRFAKAAWSWFFPLLLALSFFFAAGIQFFFNPVALPAAVLSTGLDLLRDSAGAKPAMIGGAAFLAAALFALSYFLGRFFCRVCPVGFLLGAAANLARKTAAINPEKCVSCGRCESVCPTRCADSQGKTISGIHCLGCGECLQVCAFDAVGSVGSNPSGRRQFLNASLAAGVGAAYAAARPTADWLGVPSRRPLITPPGSQGDTRHRNRCIGCMACVAACPSKVIRPMEPGRPALDMDYGFCHYNCQECADSCPAGVFTPMSLEEKRITRIAATAFVEENCVVIANGTECGACAEVCPTHAVRMIPQADDKPSKPDFDSAYCIGCGACKHVCPAPQRAFLVEGLPRHEKSRGIRHSGDTRADNQDTLSAPEGLTDFPF